MAIEVSDEPAPLVDNASRAAAVSRRSLYPGLTSLSADALAAFSRGYLPDFLGMENLVVEPQRVRARVTSTT